jgi:hypothetical protein
MKNGKIPFLCHYHKTDNGNTVGKKWKTEMSLPKSVNDETPIVVSAHHAHILYAVYGF